MTDLLLPLMPDGGNVVMVSSQLGVLSALSPALQSRFTDRASNPLRFYAALEGLVALTAAATPAMLEFVQGLYLRLGGTVERLG